MRIVRINGNVRGKLSKLMAYTDFALNDCADEIRTRKSQV